jgi:hypothetical protein
MAAGEADRRADAVGVEGPARLGALMKRLYISMPPDLTMMVEEALALIERPPPPPEEREMNELIRRTSTSTWLPWLSQACAGVRIPALRNGYMMSTRSVVSTAKPRKPARITNLKVENFRALRNVELKNLTPLTVLLGPNGSGKSTVFDVFAFLSECFESGLRRAWDRRGRGKELKTRGSDGPLVIEIKYSEPGFPLITYHLAVDERKGSPIVVEEWLRWKRGSYGQPFRFLDYKEGRGKAVSGETPDVQDTRKDISLQSPDLIAVNALGQFADHPRVAALREFITGWYVSYSRVTSSLSCF